MYYTGDLSYHEVPQGTIQYPQRSQQTNYKSMHIGHINELISTLESVRIRLCLRTWNSALNTLWNLGLCKTLFTVGTRRQHIPIIISLNKHTNSGATD